MRTKMAEEAERGNKHFSHFSPETNLFEELEKAFRDYGESGTGTTRHYVHDDDEAKLYGAEPGTFTEWGPLPEKSDLLFYEGLHGAVVTDKVNIARYADLKIGVVPVINLEWIQKLHRDRSDRGYTAEAVTDTILRRMPDYVNYICPQFAETDINFQRVPTVDTSNPFIARWIPTPDESMVVIRLRNPRGMDTSLSAVDDSTQLHVARQFNRDSRVEARPRNATHPHPADPPTHGTQEAQRMTIHALSVASRPDVSHAQMANAIRFLAIDAVEKAKSGHPGMPMGMADVATVLFSRFLKFDAADPRGRTATGSCCRPAMARCCLRAAVSYRL